MDDLISRKEAIDEISKYGVSRNFLKILIDLPSAQKTGEWLKDKDGNTSCTNCGFTLEDWIQGTFYRFCPNCGAQMGVMPK